MEGHALPQPAPRRRRAADPAAQRLQDQRPHRARPRVRGRRRRPARSPRLRRPLRAAATSRARCTRSSRTTLDALLRPVFARSSDGAHGAGVADAARALAGDRPAHARRAGPGPKFVDGLPVEGTFRAHQVPLVNVRDNPEHLQLLEEWMRSYRPERLFDARGHARPSVTALAPRGDKRMGAIAARQRRPAARPLNLPGFTRLRDGR